MDKEDLVKDAQNNCFICNLTREDVEFQII